MSFRRSHPNGQDSRHRAGTIQTRRPFQRAATTALIVLAAASVALVAVLTAGSTGRGQQRATQLAAAATNQTAPSANMATYTGTVTNGSTANDLYNFLSSNGGAIVWVNLTVSKPFAASLNIQPQKIQLKSNCNTSSPPGNCAALLNLSGVQLLIQDAGKNNGTSVTSSGGNYIVQGAFSVSPVTMDSTGMYTVRVRGVSVSAPVFGADPDE